MTNKKRKFLNEKKKASRLFTPRRTLKKLREQKGNCYYCKKSLTYENVTIEHTLPVCKGWLSTLENTTLACISCNMRKGSLTGEEYFAKYKRGLFLVSIINLFLWTR